MKKCFLQPFKNKKNQLNKCVFVLSHYNAKICEVKLIIEFREFGQCNHDRKPYTTVPG